MNCSPLIAYVLLCIAFFIPYPRYSLHATNIVGNIVMAFLLYYLCSIGWKRIAWAVVVVPLLFIAIFARDFFNNFARSYEKK
jgi:hypothetical protein